MAGLGILLSGSGSTYENLAQAGFPIAVVIASKPDCGGVERARRLGHPVVVATAAEAVTAALRAHGATWVAMCGWLRFYDPPADFVGRVVNIHPSLLPAFGGQGMYGRHVHAAVLAHGCRISGCTAHLVAGGYDTGPILAQQAVGIAVDETPESLAVKVQQAERELYPRVLTALIAHRWIPGPHGRRLELGPG